MRTVQLFLAYGARDSESVLKQLDGVNLAGVSAAERLWFYRWLGEADGGSQRVIEKLVALAKAEADAFCRRELASAAVRLSDQHDVTPSPSRPDVAQG
jgi:hypothetical protein